MKKGQKITRVKLKISSDDSYCLIGIVTADPDYKLSLALNRRLNISLKSSPPVEIIDENGFVRRFSRFAYTSSSHELSYTLVSNLSDNEALLKKLNKIDYFFMVHSTEEEPESESFAALLRTIESITAVFVFSSAEIKDKNIDYLIH